MLGESSSIDVDWLELAFVAVFLSEYYFFDNLQKASVITAGVVTETRECGVT